VKVLFVTHSYPRVPGDAAGSFLWHLAVALRGEGVEVRVIAPSGDDVAPHDVFDGIPVDRFRYAPRRYENLAYTGNMATEVQRSWSAKFALVGFLGSEFAAATRIRREFAPDIVHAHWWFPGGLVGSWVATMGHLPMVTTMHGTDVRLARSKSFAQPLFRHVMRHSAAVTTVSRWLADEVEAMMPGLRPHVAPMPVSTAMFSPGGDRHGDRLLFVGRLNAQKGIGDLVHALARLQRPAHLDVVGDGPDRAALAGLADSLGVASRIRWLGALPQTQLPALYRAATALVVPSIGEGLGLVAVEAQLCQTPVVAYASGGTTDTVRDGETGVLVPAGDVPALATALDALLADPARQVALGQGGRMNALAMFAPESAARRYAALYRSVVPR
jgi:glycosyltransferase involved in cell wall biosynthesis